MNEKDNDENITSAEEVHNALRFAGYIVVGVWAVVGLVIAWLASWIWSILFQGQNIFYTVCGIYVVLSVAIAWFVAWRAKMAQGSDA